MVHKFITIVFRLDDAIHFGIGILSFIDQYGFDLTYSAVKIEHIGKLTFQLRPRAAL
ncbi:hypothetical protein D3C73_712230 [compost metagenome]